MKHNSIIEQLEARIAPASVTVNDVAKLATWTDHDGDMVTLKWTTKAPAFDTTDKGVGLLVDKINLTAANNSNESFTLTVKAGPLGDGHVDLGYISAKNVPLKSWSSPAASVLDIDCGNGTVGIGTLTVGSLATAGGSGFAMNIQSNAVSEIDGATTSVKILGDIGAGGLNLTKAGKMKSLTVGGSLRGTDDAGVLPSGFLGVAGTSLDLLSIGGSVIGGSKTGDGQVFVSCPVGSLVIKGSILGGTGESTGYVSVSAKLATVGGSLVGNTGISSGVLFFGDAKSLTVGGSIIGGQEGSSGRVGMTSVGSLLVKGSVMGGLHTAATVEGSSGAISIANNATSIKIGGDLVAGTYQTGTKLGYNGAVMVGGNLGSITVTGNIIGNLDTEALIIAKGVAPATPGNYNGIGKVTVGGSVSYGYIASGQARDGTDFSSRIGLAENPDAGIGSVTVGGDWFHSNLTAGVNDGSTSGFTTADTHSAGDAARLAKIGAVAIKGYVLDNPFLPKFSGFGADKIASIVAHGVKLFKTGDAARSLDAAGFVDVKEFA